MVKMTSSRLRHPVRIQQNNATAGGSGDYYQDTPVWEPYLDAWAEIDSGPSRKFYAAKQVHEEATHVITIHWRSDFDWSKEIRFVWTDAADRTHTAYPLGPPANLDGQANQWLEFVCVERV